MPSSQASSEPLIDTDLAAFLGGAVSMLVATAGTQRQPSLVRALGCRLSADRRELTLWLDRERSAPLIAQLQENPAVAVVFSQPSTHRTLQFKASRAAIVALEDGDAERASAYCERMVPELARVGMSETFTRAFLRFAAADLIGLRLRPIVAFSQSPGPQAGQLLGASS